MNFLIIRPIQLLLLLASLSVTTQAAAQVGSTAIDTLPELTNSELAFMLQQQEKRFDERFKDQADALSAQKKLIDEQAERLSTQANTIQSLKDQFDKSGTSLTSPKTTSAAERQELEAQKEAIATQTAAIQALQNQFDQFNQEQQQKISETDQQLRARLESLEGTVTGLTTDETTTTYDATEFEGAFQVPGSAAAIRIGGFAKANVVQNVDGGIGDANRFLVGQIPTRGAQNSDEEANLNVRQSRLNIEYRQSTKQGQLRAYVEGDFAGLDSNSNDTFRLRHAFGQFQDVMAGKHWTNFMDIGASPEEIDFEGTNGRINVRQTQLRYFPEFGNGWNLILSMEDPQAEVTDGEAISKVPDFVASIRRTVRDEWDVKASVLARSIEARWAADETVKDDEIGWGFSVSGRRAVNWWDPRDNVSVQVSYGEGFGRYVNDLGSVGGQDGFFDDAGNLKVLPVFASYVSLNKWWRDGLRSTSTLSIVDVDNQSGQAAEAYDRTWRWGTNLIWSPVPAIDIGGELLLGERKDNDGSKGDATQLQFAARYRF
ncbi:MAG: DcaP family trimeric outer membrane transporter [Gammaproteobacteria bacterium]